MVEVGYISRVLFSNRVVKKLSLRSVPRSLPACFSDKTAKSRGITKTYPLNLITHMSTTDTSAAEVVTEHNLYK